MSEQEYQLRIGVQHHFSLKTHQLIEFLQNQSNQFLANQLTQNLHIRQSFTTNFEPLFNDSPIDHNDYVGLILLYSSSSVQSFNYVRSRIPKVEQLNDLFLLFVEMDNTEKKLNVIGNEGQLLCNQLGLLFIRLSLYNSQDLVKQLNQSLYYLIDSYYRSKNEMDNLQQKTYQLDYEVQCEEISEKNDPSSRSQQEKEKELLRQSLKRHAEERMEITADEKALDQSIENVESVLNNINGHIKGKLQSEWFSALKSNLYRPIQKESTVYSKMKLTQQFIDDQPQSPQLSHQTGVMDMKYHCLVQQQLKKLEASLIKIVIMLSKDQIAEVEVYESRTYEEMALIALGKLKLQDTPKNVKLMKEKICEQVQNYAKQLFRAVKETEKQRIFQKSYLAALKK